MSRVFITIDENYPTPELNVNGQLFRMSKKELNLLAEEIKWAQGAIPATRAALWCSLNYRWCMTHAYLA